MHILRWLMKHPILLAWLLAVVAILLNFGIGSKPSEEGAHTVAKHDARAQPVAQVAEVPAQPVAQVAEVPAQPVAQVAEVPAQPVAQVAEVPAQPVAQVAEVPAQPEAQVAEVPAQPEAQVAEVPAQPEAQVAEVPAQTDTAAPADLLRSAREAYWANELDRAVTLYSDLLKQSPESIEFKGELANVYWKQGNSQEAAKLFTEVAPQLAAQGRTTEALNMKLYVDMVSPELAKEIDAALDK
ncbi:tetratricopeptide repeat protein [Thiothrix lacustris]|uniref:tetratricopeptide repeat protein n=1 Tax=Thiothrix lacustris TaxID=525917 RepID=UPI00048FB2BB|nr:tetratricopeptide repeat protein [Thiothrix lacustris]